MAVNRKGMEKRNRDEFLIYQEGTVYGSDRGPRSRTVGIQYVTEFPSCDSNLTKPLNYLITVEDGLVKLWLHAVVHGKGAYYGKVLKDLRINQ